MKKIITSILVLIIVVILAFFNPVYAVNSQDEYLNVDYSIEELDNSSIQMKLVLRNTSNIELTNLKIKNNIPNEFELVEKSEDTVISLKPQETVTKLFFVKEKHSGNTNGGSFTGKDNSSKNDSSTDFSNKSNIETNDKASTSVSNRNTNLKISGDKKSTKVKSGDSTNVQVFLAGLIVSGLLAYLIIRKKKFRKIMILFIVGIMVLSNINLVQAINKEKIIHVEKNIKYDGKSYDFSSDITYLVDEIVDNNTLTRIEWLTKLINAMHYQEASFSELDESYFIDVSNEADEKIINYAVMYKIIDTEQENFYPNGKATREFMAVTTVKALGYNPIRDFECIDHDSIDEPTYVETAIAIGAISLENNYFYPQRPATVTESKYALDVINKTIDSEKIDRDAKNKITYQDGVVELNKDDVINVSSGEMYLINNETNRLLKEGNVIVVNNNTYKIEEKSIINNEIVLTTTEPKLEEIVKNIDIQGNAKVDYDHIKVEEGVICTVNNGNSSRMARTLNVDEDGKFDMSKVSISLDYDKELKNKFKVKGKVDIDFDSIVYKIKLDAGLTSGVDVHDILFKMNEDAKVSSSISVSKNIKVDLDKKDDQDKKDDLKICEIPIAAWGPILVDLGVFLQVDVTGNAKVYLSCNLANGMQVKNNRTRKISDCKIKDSGAEMEATVKVGGILKPVVKVLDMNLLDFSAEIGGNITGKFIARSVGHCLELKLFVYFEMSLCKENSILNSLNMTATFNIWDEDNSPLKMKGHFESKKASLDLKNYKKVKKCSYKEGSYFGVIKNSKTKKEISNCQVTIINPDTNEVVEAVKTNSNGEFEVKLSANNYYIISIQKDGYKSYVSKKYYLKLDENKEWKIELDPLSETDIDKPGEKDDVSDKYYLENQRIVDSGRYTGNQGDSFVYTIGKHQNSRGNVDINGKSYEHGLELWIARWNFTEEMSWAYATYDLNDEFTTLKGSTALIKSANVTNFNSKIEFYGDGQLIKSYDLSPATIPFDIEVDVRGVKELKVYGYDTGYYQGGTSIGLIDMELTKKLMYL